MSAAEILLFLLGDDHGLREWLLLRDGAVAARGASYETASEQIAGTDLRLIDVALAVPGSHVAVHWLDLPGGMSSAQRMAAARIAVAGVAAQPAERLHVAVGRAAEESEAVPVALVDAETMDAWVSGLRQQGFDPDLVVPLPLLLAPPADGLVCYDEGGLPSYRGSAEAFSVEPALASLIATDLPVVTIDRAGLERDLPERLADAEINLRQGAFAKRRRWALERRRLRRLALLACAILILAVAIPVAATLRYTFAADRLEAELARVAGEALGRDVRLSDPALQLERRVAERGGGGAGFDRLAAGLFAAAQGTAGAELVALDYDGRGGLRASVAADVPATLDVLRGRIEASGLSATAGTLESVGGEPRADIVVRAR